MNTEQLRQAFLDYFEKHGHTIVPSSSLVPEDSTLLFTNAGMVQFKDTFLGSEARSYTRAASSQRCVRAGGKHNDLENVGYTARHHTFFEMLGNFSFGDYFKPEAIQFAWNFLTKVLKLPENRLWVTVFTEDSEAENIWLNDIKIDPKRFSRCGAKDNFWSMGDTGPCGPCTEIFYDHGSEIAGGPPGSIDEDGDRYVEIWNLVFMQYNRFEDGTLSPLPKPSVDTGMGLERIAAVMQGVHSNYDIDIFKKLIQSIIEIGNIQDTKNQSLRVIADHIRSCAFLIVDGVLPSNEGRGYVLRRIARRAIRHGHRLGFTDPFFYRLVKPLAQVMGEAYPEFIEKISLIERALQQEEVQFNRTLDQGLKILENDLTNITGNLIPGETVFRLYDTYGFPVDLTNDIARERGLTIDMAGFNESMKAQKTRARESSQFGVNYNDHTIPMHNHTTDFVGYDFLKAECLIVGLYQDGKAVSELQEGETGAVVLEHSPFYAESGGQLGDQGVFTFKEGIFEVQNTRKVGDAHFHHGIVKKGVFSIDDRILASVDQIKRNAIALNHSATHLLHAALRQIVGTHVQQKGSLVEPDRLRFDFSHFEPLSRAQITEIEKLVNEKIRENSAVETEVLPIEEAIANGAMALFGEKYGKAVRVLHMGSDFSVELCGGTHVKHTGDIGVFKITAEYGIASGIRRLEALTGARGLDWMNAIEAQRDRLALFLKCKPETLEDKLQQLAQKNRQLEKDLQTLKALMMTGKGNDLEKVLEEKIQKTPHGMRVLAAKLPVGDIKILRETVDHWKSKLGSRAVIVLGGINDQNRVCLVAGITRDCQDQFKANELVNIVAAEVAGKGGGRPDMAEAGGSQPEHLDKALGLVYDWVLQSESLSTSTDRPMA
jgi:alanyl-tRNA synthetase